jgi:hypothetical protein
VVKFVCGVLMVLFGVILTGWVGYNLLIERHKEFQMSLVGGLFLAGLYYVGGKWISENWEPVSLVFRAKKRPKKKTRKRSIPQ